MNKIIGIGDTDIDVYIKVPKIAGHDEKVKGQLIGEFPGGMIGNFCAAASRFGNNPVGIISSIGDDPFGDIALKSFQSDQVELQGLQIRKGLKTYYCIVLLDDSGEKALTIVPTKAMFPDINEIDTDILRSANYIHATGGDQTLLEFICKKVSKETILSVDLETTMLEQLLISKDYFKKVNILFINGHTIRTLFPERDQEESMKILSNKGPSLIVLTLGGGGSIAYDRNTNSFTTQNAFSVPVIDTTGAGDCYNGIFVSSLAEGYSLKEAMRFSSAGAALSIQKFGARTSQPTKQQVVKFLEKND